MIHMLGLKFDGRTLCGSFGGRTTMSTTQVTCEECLSLRLPAKNEENSK